MVSGGQAFQKEGAARAEALQRGIELSLSEELTAGQAEQW